MKKYRVQFEYEYNGDIMFDSVYVKCDKFEYLKDTLLIDNAVIVLGGDIKEVEELE